MQESLSGHVSSNSDSFTDTSDSENGGRSRRQRKKRSLSRRGKRKICDAGAKKGRESRANQDDRKHSGDARKNQPFELPDCLTHPTEM